MRLIDADKLPKNTGYAVSASEVAMAVENAPTVDAVPLVRARWYWDAYKYDWCCDNCFHPADHHIDKDDAYNMPSFPFCPHCGADMREPNLDTTKGDNHD